MKTKNTNRQGKSKILLKGVVTVWLVSEWSKPIFTMSQDFRCYIINKSLKNLCHFDKVWDSNLNFSFPKFLITNFMTVIKILNYCIFSLLSSVTVTLFQRYFVIIILLSLKLKEKFLAFINNTMNIFITKTLILRIIF